MKLRKIIKAMLFKAGYDVVKCNQKRHPLTRRMQLISAHNVNLILDVGANVGQYATVMRDIGYKGRIVSFEPVTSAYKELVKYARNDPFWCAVNTALGDEDGKTKINIALDSQSSSILNISPEFVKRFPEYAYIEHEHVRVSRIDSILDEYYQAGDRIY
jgi:FkbM family methyltransferase